MNLWILWASTRRNDTNKMCSCTNFKLAEFLQVGQFERIHIASILNYFHLNFWIQLTLLTSTFSSDLIFPSCTRSKEDYEYAIRFFGLHRSIFHFARFLLRITLNINNLIFVDTHSKIVCRIINAESMKKRFISIVFTNYNILMIIVFIICFILIILIVCVGCEKQTGGIYSISPNNHLI
jgi:hypothetical protein